MARAKFKPDDVLVAHLSGVAIVDGERIHVKRGLSHFRGDDPVVKALPDWFRVIEVRRPKVEQATAAPSEERGEEPKP
jgi:hypothetical protein